jgi:excisionase family DNA binding protein
MNNDLLDLVTVQEASKMLHICRQKIYKAIEDGRLQGFKNDSGKYLIFKSSVANYVETCYNKYNNSFDHSAKGGIGRAE